MRKRIGGPYFIPKVGKSTPEGVAALRKEFLEAMQRRVALARQSGGGVPWSCQLAKGERLP